MSTRLALPVFVLSFGLACNETGFTSLYETDVFQQQRRNAVDLLLVVDNSCSMVEEQDNLARNFDTLIATFTDADVDWRLAVTTTDVEAARYRGKLVRGDDEIIVIGPSGELDRVEFDRTWPFQPGYALQLDGARLLPSYNDAKERFCTSANEFATGSFGTPGERGPKCTDGSAVPPEGGEDAGPRAPLFGDLVITEILPESSGLDSDCEWFELSNTTPDTLDLSGVVISDRGRNRVVLPDGARATPYQPVVIGRSTNCGVPVDYAFAEGFSLNDDRPFIDRDTPAARELFSEQVAQGTIGTGIEMGYEAVRLLWDPEFAAENEGFLREDAGLSVLFISDEEDSSPLPVDDYIRHFTDWKGDAAYRERGLMNVSAVIGKDLPPNPDAPSCESETGFAAYGRRYLAGANETEGLVESICETDFAPIVTRLGLTLSGLETVFELSEYPELDTLEVKLYAGEDDDSFVRDLVRDVDFTYEVEGNLLRFVDTQVPPSEHYVTARYKLLPRGQVPQDQGEDTE